MELQLPTKELYRRFMQAMSYAAGPTRNRLLTRYSNALKRRGETVPSIKGKGYDTVIFDDDFVNPVPDK